MEGYIEYFSECCHPFQVDVLVIFLTMIRNNGECMLTSLAVREGSIFLALYWTTEFLTLLLKLQNL